MTLSERDKAVVWHPYTQMKTADLPIAIVRGEGTYLFDDTEKKYIDAVSSWWVNVHGHAHPHIAKTIFAQLQTLEHVIFAGFTHAPAVELSERLLKKLPNNQQKIFFSDNGSTAVEVALKMAFQYWSNQNLPRKKIIAFKDAYHGDTFGAMSVSARSAFTHPFFPFLFDVLFIDIPSEGSENKALEQLKKAVEENKNDVAAFIFEPLLQGTAGMKMYQPSALDDLLTYCKQKKIITIADEVMTGFGRTGKFFATHYCTQKPDIYCLSKGLTGGTMAMGITSCAQFIYDAFLSDDKLKTFFHGHSYTANPVTCAAALASMDIFDDPKTFENIHRIEKLQKQFIEKIKNNPKIKNARCIGTVAAIDLYNDTNTSYFNEIRDKAYHYFLDKGVLLRPLGNIIYIMPPYCISDEDLRYVQDCIEKFIAEEMI
ncbi:MAG: adenosylmethionine--8-amino-7-oxononanoate transaminase [Bacteroidia bacterium]